MKEAIHPKYHEVEARCACGPTWKTRSTKHELHLEICSNCHPFFTGRQKLIDTEGRVERFTKKFGAQTSESRKKAAAAKQERNGRDALPTMFRSQAAAPIRRARLLIFFRFSSRREGPRPGGLPCFQAPQRERFRRRQIARPVLVMDGQCLLASRATRAGIPASRAAACQQPAASSNRRVPAGASAQRQRR